MLSSGRVKSPRRRAQGPHPPHTLGGEPRCETSQPTIALAARTASYESSCLPLHCSEHLNLDLWKRSSQEQGEDPLTIAASAARFVRGFAECSPTRAPTTSLLRTSNLVSHLPSKGPAGTGSCSAPSPPPFAEPCLPTPLSRPRTLRPLSDLVSPSIRQTRAQLTESGSQTPRRSRRTV